MQLLTVSVVKIAIEKLRTRLRRTLREASDADPETEKEEIVSILKWTKAKLP